MRRHILSCLLAAAALTGVLAPLAAQAPVPHDTLRVDVGSRLVAGAASLTRSVDVLDRAAIEALPARSAAELLARALGVDLQARSAAQADLSVRGSGFEQVLVLVDGVPVNDDQTGHFHLDHAVPLDAIDRIEVLRGPASTLYGSAAVGGVVNIVTRRGRSEVVARTQVGSFGTAAFAAEAALAAGGIAARIGAEHDRSDGHRPGTDHRVTQTRLAVDAPLGAGAVRGDVAYAERDFGADGFYAPFESYEETRTLTAAVSWLPVPASFTLQPRVAFRRHDDDFILRRTDPSFYHNTHTNRQLSAELVARWLPTAAVRFAFGAEAVRSSLDSGTLGEREEDRGAAFIEVATGAVHGTLFTGGARVDHHSVFGTFASPSVGAGWQASRTMRLRGSAGLGFRAPTWTERFYEDPANIGTADLGVERFRTAELGLEVAAAGARLDVAGFVRVARDLIDWTRPAGSPAAEPWRTLSVARATFTGVETTARAGLGAMDVTLQATALTFSAAAAAGMESKYALRPLTEAASLEVGGPLPGSLRATLRASHRRRPGDGAWRLLDARLARSFGDFHLFADAMNLLDERYPDIVGRPAPGRAFSVGARLTR